MKKYKVRLKIDEEQVFDVVETKEEAKEMLREWVANHIHEYPIEVEEEVI